MAPVLQALQDGRARPVKEIREVVAVAIGISDEDRLLVVKSGVGVFDSRVGWAVTYLVQAGLVRRPGRAIAQITERGLAVLRDNPDRVDNQILDRFEEFREFKTRARVKEKQPPAAAGVPMPPGTPHETIIAAVEESNAAVAAELLTRVREQDPAFLENLVLKLLTAMGYGGAAGSAEHLGRSGDEGLDGVIKQDPLGLDRIYVQAKRYAADRTVGRPDIQGFVGALHGAQADRGVFITTSRFSTDARDYAEKVAARVILIDGGELSGLLVKYNIGAQDSETFVLKQVDEDFFE
ncbi:restriction endonuclease [Actinoplanes sp. NPDC026670]|uniref:restriction endonuclease n=1 Tax=Actinoplanes sp. NPDC026670 TaxID=3154700 RepID=UPI0033C81D6A